MEHIAKKQATGDERYGEIELQVLFGSQPELIEVGLEALGDFPKDRTVVHVYDRVSSRLRNLIDPHATPLKQPKTTAESADAVIQASLLALRHGFTRFSISGEGAVNHEDDIDEIIGFYRQITGALLNHGATSINVNLANTFGLSPEGQWDQEGLHHFNQEVKHFDTDTPITTTAHAHNDANSATDFTLTAVEAGFDGIEGAMFGMGERPGNGSLVDVMVRLLEKGRVVIETSERRQTPRTIGKLITAMAFWQERAIPPAIADSLHCWYGAAARVAEIYGTEQRFEKTSLGNPNAYDAGCGPHAHANEIFDIDPIGNPLWRNYAMFAIVHALMGRPEALEIIEVNRERIRRITKSTHASGGSTARISRDELRSQPAPDHKRQQSEALAYDLMAKILATVSVAQLQPVVEPQEVQT